MAFSREGYCKGVRIAPAFLARRSLLRVAVFAMATVLLSPVAQAASPTGEILLASPLPPTTPAISRFPSIAHSGDILLKIVLGADAKPLAVNVIRRSGNRLLDTAAVAAVRGWTFTRDTSLLGVPTQTGYLLIRAGDARVSEGTAAIN